MGSDTGFRRLDISSVARTRLQSGRDGLYQWPGRIDPHDEAMPAGAEPVCPALGWATHTDGRQWTRVTAHGLPYEGSKTFAFISDLLITSIDLNDITVTPTDVCAETGHAYSWACSARHAAPGGIVDRYRIPQCRAG